MRSITSAIRQSIRTSIRSSFGSTVDELRALITSLFGNGEQGAFYIPQPVVLGAQSLFQDAAGTVPVTADGDPDGLMIDQSPNNINASQSTSAARPTYNANPDRLSLDKVDDALIITVPTGGWNGTMVLATDDGTASYGISIPAGAYELGGNFFPGNAVVGALFRDGTLSDSEKTDVESYFVDNGATVDYGAVSDFTNYWRGRSEITSFPVIDTSTATSIRSSWAGCNSLTIFPLLNFSNLESAENSWSGCFLLTNFPNNAFDNIKGGNFTVAFNSTNLDEASIDGILVSLVTSGISTGFLRFDQSGGSAPSVGTGQPAIDTLRSRGWTVTVTGGY